MWLKEGSATGSRSSQMRDVECIVEELADARLSFQSQRPNEVVPTKLTPVLKLYKKRIEDGGKGIQVVDGDNGELKLKLNEKVYGLSRVYG